jgi:hypothetical protein
MMVDIFSVYFIYTYCAQHFFEMGEQPQPLHRLMHVVLSMYHLMRFFLQKCIKPVLRYCSTKKHV